MGVTTKRKKEKKKRQCTVSKQAERKLDKKHWECLCLLGDFLMSVLLKLWTSTSASPLKRLEDVTCNLHPSP